MSPASKRASAAVLLAVVAVLAHGGTASAQATPDLVAAAKAEGQLNVIGLPRDWCGYGRIIDAFEARYGIRVVGLEPRAGSADQIDAIRDKPAVQRTLAPDVIDVGLSFGAPAKAEGLLQPYKVSAWETIPDAAKDAEGYWYGDYYGLLAFEINADVVAKPPSDWPDLLAPEYKSSVALAGNPKVSNQALLGVLAAGLSAAGGNVDAAADQGLRFFAELNRRGNLLPVIGDADSVAGGQTPIVIRWDYLARGDRDRLKGVTDVRVVVPRTGVVGGIYVQAISARAPHPSAARLWMDHLYSDEAQLTWLRGHCHPIRFEDLVRRDKVPANLVQEPPGKEGGEPDKPLFPPERRPIFPTEKQQERAKEIIIRGWDNLGVMIECEPSDPASIPMSMLGPALPVCAAPNGPAAQQPPPPG